MRTPLDAAVDWSLTQLIAPDPSPTGAGDGRIRILATDPARRAGLVGDGRTIVAADSDAKADVGVCVDDELGAAGEHAESLLARLVDGVRPGAPLLLAFANAVPGHGSGAAGSARSRSWRPRDVRAFLGGRGVALERLYGPGAASAVHAARRLSTSTTATTDNAPTVGAAPVATGFDPALDAEPSLVGAADVLLAWARTPTSAGERSAVFFSTIPTKTVAAATVTRRDDGAVLVVYDSFKGHWTIPGGLVDDDEDPAAAAVRETREESGIDVRTTALGAVFHALQPDRLILVFRARPVHAHARPAPIHDHEIAGAEWVSLAEALRRVPPAVHRHITESLDGPAAVHLQRRP